MVSILFVCHGNICRSPMAEFVMRDLAEARDPHLVVEVASAATSTEEIGNPVHPGTRRILERQGISCVGKRARQISPRDYERFDLLVGMDGENVRAMRRLFNGDPKNKVHKLLEFSEKCKTDQASDVADPWYTGDFETTYRDVLKGCEALLEILSS